jgi:hypothetical protein
VGVSYIDIENQVVGVSYIDIEDWWRDVIQKKRGQSRKALTSLAVLVSREISKEINARVFTKQAFTKAWFHRKHALNEDNR